MSSWINCLCGASLNKNLFCGAGLALVVDEAFLENAAKNGTAERMLTQMVVKSDVLVRCKKCTRLAIEDKKTGAIAFYLPEPP